MPGRERNKMKFISTWTKTGQEQQYLDRFDNIVVQLRAFKDTERLKEHLAYVAGLLKDGQAIILALAVWYGDTKWAANFSIEDNFGSILRYATEKLSVWREICDPYMDKIEFLVTEAEWGDTREWTDPAGVTDMNNITRSMIKHFLNKPLIMYGRGMMTYYTEDRVGLTPWWNGPTVDGVDFITPFLYDPMMPEIDNKNMIASAGLAGHYNIPMVPFVGIGIKSLGGHGKVAYAPEGEFTRGLLLKHYEGQIDAVGLYPYPDLDDSVYMEHLDWLQKGME